MCEVASDQLVDLRSEKHWSHDHPLVFTQHHLNNADCYCSMCEELIQGSSYYYCCTHFDCKFYLHNVCADLSLEINHPFFHEHPMKLQAKPTNILAYFYCDICWDRCEFFYNCANCEFAVDVKCALLPQFITGDYSKVEHVCHEHPLISAMKRKRSVKMHPCVACQESEPGPIYTCADSGCRFYIHKKCCELPTQITHPSHRKHPLFLLTDAPPHPKRCSCHLCQNHIKGFIYHCFLCKFDLKISHVLSRQFETGSHEHLFTRVSRPMPFVCDACGTVGDCIPYVCNLCDLKVHKDCIWLPKLVKISRHAHPISHFYFLLDNECQKWVCKICFLEVNTEYGSFYCSDCKYIVHVNCALDPNILEQEITSYQNYNETLRLLLDESMTSAQEITATEIKHFSHQHNLKLGDETKSDAFCDGCVQFISDHPFYFCVHRDFFLHKSCAILPIKTRFWFSNGIFTHIPYGIFRCWLCRFYSSGFNYQNQLLDQAVCLRCFSLSDIVGHQGHEHPLFYDPNYANGCTACGIGTRWRYRCSKFCDFGLCFRCVSLPKSTQHKNHKHPLALTYHDGDDSSQYYCDICEEERNPSYWFYSCLTCDFTAHIKCTLGKYPFIKRDIKFRHGDHPHRLITVRKIYYYPMCAECEQPCLDLAVECEEPECNYICHWKCLEFPDFFPITY